ncbi:MAG: hypothetical protein Q8J96_05875, partial [Rhodocyclaceae bacterium]|nr:hypothetical protein [Rhodocyclaceae bacterium]MDP3032773.1 hypothetical protein [Rhodocyclaceae bacterium]
NFVLRFLVVMVCPPKGVKVDLDNQPLTMTTRLLPTADAFAHKSAHYRRGPRLLGTARRKRCGVC